MKKHAMHAARLFAVTALLSFAQSPLSAAPAKAGAAKNETTRNEAAKPEAAKTIHLQCANDEHEWDFVVDVGGRRILRGEAPKYQQTFDENFRAENDFYYAEGLDTDAIGRIIPTKVWINRSERSILVSTYNEVTRNWYDGRYKNCVQRTPNTKQQF